MFAPLLKAPKPKAASRTTPTRAPKPRQHIPSWSGVGDHLPYGPQRAESFTGGTSDQAVQAKLRIGAIDDPLEHEADRVAEAVLASAPAPAPSPAPGLLQRKCAECEEEEQHETVRRAVRSGGGVAHQSGRDSPAGSEVAATVSRGGVPLAADLRSYFEPRFGHDFSSVRIHDNAAASAAAQSINARAFTLGRDIAFAPGEYAPRTVQGRRLIAHELAHVVQQTRTPTAFRVMRQSFAGCDKGTTGVAGPNKRLLEARDDANVKAMIARDNLKSLDPRTIQLLDRHFHCPSSSQINAIAATLDKIYTTTYSIDARCVSASNSLCRGGFIAEHDASTSTTTFCPSTFTSKSPGYDLTGVFLWGAGIDNGLDRACQIGTSCYDDFTVPASDMLKHADAFAGFVLESAFKMLQEPDTIPCRPRNTGLSVVVPPDAATDPTLIRPITGYDPSPPHGSEVRPVWEDTAGKKFIYSAHCPERRLICPMSPNGSICPTT